MSEVTLCSKCGKGLRPGQAGTWREFTALEAVGSKARRIIAREYTGRTFCGECAMPPPTGFVWDDSSGGPPEVPGAAGNTGPVGIKSLVGAAR